MQATNALGKRQQSIQIRLNILEEIRKGNQDFVNQLSEQFSISVQALHRHIHYLEESQFVVTSGKTKGKVYSLGSHRFQEKIYALKGLQEDNVYRTDFVHIFEGLKNNVDEISYYGVTEMLNNSIDHSDGSAVLVVMLRTDTQIKIVISDDGEGIFDRIARLLNLENTQDSLLELSKGKLTTDPNNHTGEGIFFTSRAFDNFAIVSGELSFTHADTAPDRLNYNDNHLDGTVVIMSISLNSDKNLGDIFDSYSSGPDEYLFDKTVVPVHLAKFEGEKLVSRSQAKRLMRRVEKFKNVVLDFSGVGFIGQAFADEIFRVYANRHPEVNISVENLNANGIKMMKRAQAHKA